MLVCEFFKERISFLESGNNKNGISMELNKIKAIVD